MAYVVDGNAHVMPASAEEATAREDATAEELLGYMRQAGVQQALLVPHPPSNYDNGYCIECARRYPESFAAVGKINMADQEPGAALPGLVKQPGTAGLRLDAPGGGDPSEWLEAPRTTPIWEAAQRGQLPVSLPSVRRLDQLPAVRRVAERFPSVPLLLMHAIVAASTEDGPPYEQARDFFALAELPNVYVAVTHHHIAEANKGRSTSRDFLESLIKAFSARRLLWASFFPARAPQDAPLKGLIDPVRSALSFLTPEDRDWILGETARSLYPMLRGATAPTT